MWCRKEALRKFHRVNQSEEGKQCLSPKKMSVEFFKLISDLKIIKNGTPRTKYNLIYENDSPKSYFKPNFQYREVCSWVSESYEDILVQITTVCGEN